MDDEAYINVDELLRENKRLFAENTKYRQALEGYIDACPMCSSGVECQDELCYAYRDLVSTRQPSGREI